MFEYNKKKNLLGKENTYKITGDLAEDQDSGRSKVAEVVRDKSYPRPTSPRINKCPLFLPRRARCASIHDYIDVSRGLLAVRRRGFYNPRRIIVDDDPRPSSSKWSISLAI